ncbi:hypothetical protein IR108_08940 [Streptococcus sp. 19428wD3_AN2]|nr:hypothetical protein [Streptococcus sp. 19428wD3_AN2]TFU82239.1 hypothetical protein E4T83_08950 [Streptococcus sp. AN2]
MFSINNQRQKTAEEERNRKYEVSLVKALKNSYRDIEKIQISSPDYSVPPGNWSCTVMLTFQDHTIVEYRIGHTLSDKTNKSATAKREVLDILNYYDGVTTSDVRVIYSNGEEGRN